MTAGKVGTQALTDLRTANDAAEDGACIDIGMMSHGECLDRFRMSSDAATDFSAFRNGRATIPI
jgi:hypothetical protein